MMTMLRKEARAQGRREVASAGAYVSARVGTTAAAEQRAWSDPPDHASRPAGPTSSSAHYAPRSAPNDGAEVLPPALVTLGDLGQELLPLLDGVFEEVLDLCAEKEGQSPAQRPRRQQGEVLKALRRARATIY